MPYNRPDLLEAAFAGTAAELAAVICEPIYYNAGCILPTPEFLRALRRLTREHGVLLIFDEVLSAFRMAPGGAQEYLGVTPDLCTLGKAVGGGYPAERLRRPRGHHGPADAARAIASTAAPTTAIPSPSPPAWPRSPPIAQPGFYDHIHAVADRLYGGLNELFTRHGVTARVQGLGARFGIYFGVTGPVRELSRRRAAPARADAALHRGGHPARRLLPRLRRRRLPSRLLCRDDQRRRRPRVLEHLDPAIRDLKG